MNEEAEFKEVLASSLKKDLLGYEAFLRKLFEIYLSSQKAEVPKLYVENASLIDKDFFTFFEKLSMELRKIGRNEDADKYDQGTKEAMGFFEKYRGAKRRYLKWLAKEWVKDPKQDPRKLLDKFKQLLDRDFGPS